MNWNNFKNRFHSSWHSKMQEFIESEECDNIYKYLKENSKKGEKIAPLSMNVFRAFKETSLNNLKFVIIGPPPSYVFTENKNPEADGLLFGCNVTEKPDAYLRLFYKTIENKFHNGLNLDFKQTPDLTYLTQQGVLLLHEALTTSSKNQKKHIELWEPFIIYLLSNVLDVCGIPVLFIGKTQRFKKYIGNLNHAFTLPDIELYLNNGKDWDEENVLLKIDELMYETNGVSIEWLCDAEMPF